MTVDILGTEYQIVTQELPEDIYGACNHYERAIVIVDFNKLPDWKDATKEARERARRETLRHEIVHAFFNESGLSESANAFEGAWCKNEEMVDWIAMQGEKLVKAWKEARCL